MDDIEFHFPKEYGYEVFLIDEFRTRSAMFQRQITGISPTIQGEKITSQKVAYKEAVCGIGQLFLMKLSCS